MYVFVRVLYGKMMIFEKEKKVTFLNLKVTSFAWQFIWIFSHFEFYMTSNATKSISEKNLCDARTISQWAKLLLFATMC